MRTLIGKTAKMASHLVKTNKPKSVKGLFLIIVALCVFQYVNVMLTYSRNSLLLITQIKYGEMLGPRKLQNAIEDEDDTLKIVNRIIVEKETNITGNQVLKDSMPFNDHMGENHAERALAIICMGMSAASSNYVERFVWSARNIGKFTGWIVLLTDAPEGRYENLGKDWTDTDNAKLSILRPEQQHKRNFKKGRAMVHKQFKTYILQYMKKDPRLDEVRLVYYLDVDIVFGNSISPLFHDLEHKYNIGGRSATTMSTSNSNSVAKMWMFQGNSEAYKIQGGQMILDRATSEPCLNRFRSLMDPETSTIDQVHLMKMRSDQNHAKETNDYSSLECEIVEMSQEEKHIIFPTSKYINNVAENKIAADHQPSVLNHIKNTGGDLKKSSPENVEAFLRYLFGFKAGQADPLGITMKQYLDGGQREKKTSTQQLKTKAPNEVRLNATEVVGTDDDGGLAFESSQGEESEINHLKKRFPGSQGEESEINHLKKNFPGLTNGIVIANRKVTADGSVKTLTIKNRRNRKKKPKKKDEFEDDIERAMFLVSMGKKAAQMKTVERFVYSARNNGKYSGWIVVVTDAPEGRYDGMNKWTENVIIMEPKEEDVKSHYNLTSMSYKRFKTLAIDYMDRDPRLDLVELVYYLDVDIVFGANMNKAFNGLETTYGIGPLGANSPNATSPLGKGRMWMFKGNSGKWQIQGGQMILERKKSQPCLERWRKGFDRKDSALTLKDQYLLMEIKAEMDAARNASTTNLTQSTTNSTSGTLLECEIVLMEQEPYIEFPVVNTIRRRSVRLQKKPNEKYEYAPMVHVRNDGGTATMRDKMIRPYMANLLGMKQKQRDPLGVLKTVRMETTASF
jgi:hypothetical protein